MDSRRDFLKFFSACLAVVYLPLSRVAAAVEWNQAGFSARTSADVLSRLNAGTPTLSPNIQLILPDIADNGQQVPVFVASKIPNTQAISLIVENNQHPLAASFDFSSGASPQFSTVLKIRRTSVVKVIVRADNQYFWFGKEVKVATAELPSR